MKCGNIVEPFYVADDINIKCLGSICNEINLLADDFMYLIEKNEY